MIVQNELIVCPYSAGRYRTAERPVSSAALIFLLIRHDSFATQFLRYKTTGEFEHARA